MNCKQKLLSHEQHFGVEIGAFDFRTEKLFIQLSVTNGGRDTVQNLHIWIFCLAHLVSRSVDCFYLHLTLEV